MIRAAATSGVQHEPAEAESNERRFTGRDLMVGHPYQPVREQAVVAITKCWEDCTRAYTEPEQLDPHVIFALIVNRLIIHARTYDLSREHIRDVLENELRSLDLDKHRDT